mmetsp:Transcript_144816/g.250682  ORF Transcript_144816/g.250682 Transcript_144816/m.250682 type:complete len:578 (+) Transcript_144816:75-1808(+)
MLRLLCLAGALASAGAQRDVDHCTAVIAGPKATAHGATFVGQTNDFEGGPGDSLLFVAAADHAAGSVRPIYDQDTGKHIGDIPQVSHTYAYSKACYGVMNEHKLAFGESTCSGRFWAASLAHNGTALFSNQALSEIALERCQTARCAIKLMGNLAVNHGGFYGEGATVHGGSETLLVADPNEAWVFNILADPTGYSAIWAAQRVPDDEVTVVPNVFVIRAMEENSPDFYLSSNAKKIAVEYGFWDGKGVFDFARTYSLGEYANPHYAARRMWRAYSLFAPSLELDGSKEITDTDGAYPFAVRPDRLLEVTDVFAMYRDYYEGTPYSLVKDDLAAGPFNSPIRVAAGSAENKFDTGAWERPISVYRANYAVVSTCSSTSNGVVWFAPHTPHASVFAPAWSSSATTVSRAYSIDKTLGVDRQSLFWAASAVSNWAYGSNFKRAIVDIREAQAKLEATSLEVGTKLESEPSNGNQNQLIEGIASKVHSGWWDLFFFLMGKYTDGYVVTHEKDGSVTSTQVGYPSWWLKAVHFEKGVKTSSQSFAKQKARMDAAEKKMAEINKKRVPPKRVFVPASSSVIV